MRAAVICRGSLTEGLGHVTRAAALATELGEDLAAFVVIGDEGAANTAWEHSNKPRVVSTDSEAVDIVDQDLDAIFIDLQAIKHSCFQRLQRRAPVISLSPIFEYQSEVVRSYSRTRAEPNSELARDPDRHRRGIQYTIVGKHVRRVTPPEYVTAVYESSLNVGVAMGGSDAVNMTKQVVETLGAVEHRLVVWAMLGEGYGHSYDALVNAIRSSGRHEALLAKASHSMWTVLSRSALLVLAGGVTSYEAAFAGVPSLNLTSESSRYLVDELESAGVARTLAGPESWAGLPLIVDELASDRDSLFAMHRRTTGLIDGEGARRIVEEVTSLVEGT